MRCDKCLREIGYDDVITYPKFFIQYKETMSHDNSVPIYLCTSCQNKMREWLLQHGDKKE